MTLPISYYCTRNIHRMQQNTLKSRNKIDLKVSFSYRCFEKRVKELYGAKDVSVRYGRIAITPILLLPSVTYVSVCLIISLIWVDLTLFLSQLGTNLLIHYIVITIQADD